MPVHAEFQHGVAVEHAVVNAFTSAKTNPRWDWRYATDFVASFRFKDGYRVSVAVGVTLDPDSAKRESDCVKGRAGLKTTGANKYLALHVEFPMDPYHWDSAARQVRREVIKRIRKLKEVDCMTVDVSNVKSD